MAPRAAGASAQTLPVAWHGLGGRRARSWGTPSVLLPWQAVSRLPFVPEGGTSSFPKVTCCRRSLQLAERPGGKGAQDFTGGTHGDMCSS